jgi:rhodanese-related sulfurtransferase/DNA-binding transcriptional ArsR family regulator
VKARLYEQVAVVGKALASGRRLEILEVLAQGERTVDALGHEVGLSIANTSHHLHALKDAGLVESRKEGLYVHYRLAAPEVFDLVRDLRSVAERRSTELSRLMHDFVNARDQLEPVGREELQDRVREGLVIVLDVRPPAEYQAGHIPGAVSLPIGELERRLATLPRDKEIVAYCRGPYCLMAYQAVEILRSRGRTAHRLVEGFPEWRAAGFPVEAASPAEG